MFFLSSYRNPRVVPSVEMNHCAIIADHSLQTKNLCFQHTIPTTADDSSPRRARDDVKPSRP